QPPLGLSPNRGAATIRVIRTGATGARGCNGIRLSSRCERPLTPSDIVYNDTIQYITEGIVETASARRRITCNIDFDKDGRQAGYCRAPLSRNTSGWGTIEIPIIVVKNGKGPTLLLTGGVHGDEYEGPIAISRLSQTLDWGSVQGRVIMMP